MIETATPTVRELKEAMNVLNTLIERTDEYNKARFEQFGLTEEFCKFVGTMSDEDIDGLTLSQINLYLEQYGIDPGNILQTFYRGDNSVSAMDKWKEFFLELRRAVRDMDKSLTTREELEQAFRDVYAKQTEFIQSAEYREAYEKKIEAIRAMAEKEPDDVKKKAYLRKLDAIQKSRNLSFLLDRLDDPKINKKDPNAEIKRLVGIFFDKDRGSYLMDRYVTTIRKLKVSTDYHVNLYNIEEKFLPESFHPFNNFFLFVVMSYIAYIDPEDDVDYLYATTALSMMGNLLMGEINKEDEKVLMNMIRNIENRILADDDMVAKFRSDNTTWKEHPVRMELDAKKEEMKYRVELISEIKELMVGFGANLSDGTQLTAKNASFILKTMSTEQIKGIRDEVKAEAERHVRETTKDDDSTDEEGETSNGAISDDTPDNQSLRGSILDGNEEQPSGDDSGTD